MKFTIKRQTLQKLLSTSSKAISNKIIIPILSGIKFDITKDKIALTGSSNVFTILAEDTDIESFHVENEGSFILPAKYIVEIIRKMNDEWINFETIDTNLITVSTEKAEFTLKCLPIEDYPKFYFIENEAYFTTSIQGLKQSLNETSFCVSQNESRPALTGINFQLEGKNLILTGSDSFRLSQKKMTIATNEPIEKNCIIPGKTAQELLKLMNDSFDQEIKIHFSDNKFLFAFDQIKVQTNLVEGKYPETTKAIPQTFAFDIKLQKEMLLHSVDLASLLSREIHNSIVNFNVEKNTLEVSSLSEEVGKVWEKVDIQNPSQQQLKLAVNGQFVLDALKVIDSEMIYLKFNNELMPFVIMSEQQEDLLQVIVPLRTH